MRHAVADPAEAAELYALPLDAFTAARNALAARLRKAGDRAGSEAVKGLAKPSVSAWALNQVAHRQPGLVERLLSAADELRRAQQRLLAGAGQRAFREASQTERAAVVELVSAAGRALEEGGHKPAKAMLDRIEATARAAAADPDAGALLRAGRLVRDVDPAGFGGLEGVFGSPAAPIPFPVRRPRPTHEPSATAGGQLAAMREDVERLRRQLRELKAEAGEQESAAARKRDAAAKARDAAIKARQEAERAGQAARKAQLAADDAAEEVDRVRSQIERTEEELEKASAALRRLRD
jgi:DNA repair exonuclease SbcCD ATPase subunit